MTDLIRGWRSLAFASRLKRLSDRLMRDVSMIYRKHELDFEARWFPLLYALHLEGELSITELSSALGITHPAVNQLSTEMIRKGIVESSKSLTDERKRLLRLTSRGKEMVRVLQPLWQIIQETTGELLGSAGIDLLAGLDAIEAELDRVDMFQRLWARLYGEKIDQMEVTDYRSGDAASFKELNYEWLEEYFSVEPADETVLSGPEEHILKGGGAVFFVRIGGKNVGTCALLIHSDTLIEATRLAVSEDYRNLGIGGALLEVAIQRARALGYGVLYFRSSPSLREANRLLRKIGFRKARKSPFSRKSDEYLTMTFRLNLIPGR